MFIYFHDLLKFLGWSANFWGEIVPFSGTFSPHIFKSRFFRCKINTIFCIYFRMPRKYVRKPGMTINRPETLEQILTEIRQKRISVRAAALKYGIHRNVLSNKLKNKAPKKCGGQTIFTEDEEAVIVAHIVTLSSYGFPVNKRELRFIVKSFLDKQGRTVVKFKNNLPGIEWANSFVSRHAQQISNRTARNITYSRASVNEKVVNEFFNNLEKELEGVPPSHIWNYDETCLVDDPGISKVLVKRGCKYPENIKNSSKSNTSIMMCGSAGGELAPVYVVYKAEKMWESWTENGPEKCRYNRTKSGWFDFQCFEDWFVSLMLPILKKQQGKKVLLGDNLSSHINAKVIDLCHENDISFIALPPNATHLLQPLDVAFFRPVKIAWRKVLNEWNEHIRNSRCMTVPKDEFPGLLKRLLELLKENSATNLKAGFRKCGIVPANRHEVLQRLPMYTIEALPAVKALVGEIFIENLNSKRQTITSTRTNKKRKKVNVPPGKSITASDINPQNNHDTPVSLDEPSTSSGQTHKQPDPPRRFTKLRDESDSENESTGHVSYAESDQSPYSPQMSEESDTDMVPIDTSSTKVQKGEVSAGDYVLVMYENHLYPGQVKEVADTTVLISAMEKCGGNWKWPLKPDSIWYFYDDIKQKINKPCQISKREIFKIPELS